MYKLRTSMLARLVLAFFALVLVTAVLSPIIHPRTMEIVCTADGTMKMVAVGDDEHAGTQSEHQLKCSMCLPSALPTPQHVGLPKLPQPLAHALTPIAAAHIAALTGAPLPPRGPPSFL